jgi:hypothetical protein
MALRRAAGCALTEMTIPWSFSSSEITKATPHEKTKTDGTICEKSTVCLFS